MEKGGTFMPEEQQKTCRICGFGPYSPSFTFDFYEDDVDGEGTGRCEKCMMNPPSQVEISEEQVKNVCKMGQPGTCRFLTFEDKFKCAKWSRLHEAIMSRAEKGEMRAKGDNCTGPKKFTLIVTKE